MKVTSFLLGGILYYSIAIVSLVECATRSFTVDYNSGTFVKDGKPFNYVSGSIHYSRVRPEQWHDRLYKMRYAGLDAIQVYIPWNFHETERGQFDFSGGRDLERFLTLAQELNLLVILRPGPYICAEWEFGGFPYWIIKDNANIALRSSDPVYMSFVTEWYNVLLPKVRPFLYVNGGPIISVQIENEYGSFQACDHSYLQQLLALNKKLLVEDVVYFTTDGDSLGYLKCGAIDGTLTTVDFGSGNATKAFQILNQWNPSFKGPYVNSEYYIGWLDAWGSKHSQVAASSAAQTLDEILAMKANVNMYMFFGGTNFGFTSGAPSDQPFKPVPTSYDYDAALNEAGDMTYKYSVLRNTIGKYKQLPEIPDPVNSTKVAYGVLGVDLQGPLHRCIPLISKLTAAPSYHPTYPLRSEVMDTGYGFIMYRHILTEDVTSANLSVPGIRDRGYVMVNYQHFGVLYRDGPTELAITGNKGDTLFILVDNMGRVGYGSGLLRGTKGIISNVTIGAQVNVTVWSIFNYRLNISLIQQCNKILRAQSPVYSPLKFVPSTFLGLLNIAGPPADTFLRLDGWTKGIVSVNDFIIGRYWPVRGPQQTLYVPSTLLVTGQNRIAVTELEGTPCTSQYHCQIKFVDVPDINSNVSMNSLRLVTHHG